MSLIVTAETGPAPKHVEHGEYAGDDEKDDVHGRRHDGFLSADG
jgi:hypothetical protein